MAAGDVDVAFTKVRAFNSNVFDGVDDYVEIPHNAAQLGANLSNGFTISAWINARSAGELAGVILNKGSGVDGENGFVYGISGSPGSIKRYFKINNGTQRTTTTYANYPTNWIHVLVTVGSTINHYTNGVLDGGAGAMSQAISTITNTGVMRIGNEPNGTTRTFDGSIRSVKMWNKVLSTTEIASDYAGSPTAESNLILNVPLGGDYSNGTNSGSIVQTVEDNLAAAIKTQRTAAGASSKHLICSGIKGQIYHAAITE
jgi:hypothetical protein